MKVSALIVALILGVTVTANCETIASLSGPDHGGELISASRVVSFRFIMSATYVDVTVSARLAAPFGSFDGTAYLNLQRVLLRRSVGRRTGPFGLHCVVSKRIRHRIVSTPHAAAQQLLFDSVRKRACSRTLGNSETGHVFQQA